MEHTKSQWVICIRDNEQKFKIVTLREIIIISKDRINQIKFPNHQTLSILLSPFYRLMVTIILNTLYIFIRTKIRPTFKTKTTVVWHRYTDIGLYRCM